ncbi:hypothetical protein CD30_06965 [Ureibacillus massiliensis 4400831 = CIP 108448 = CCUG 49529]|uniref:Uncharacterized protein n=1 Tax=Ureibacillus massiliensis 4400831 = CIP 108448 = CCUG 49529 TaxID=1211035 RepID=A0A0A3J2D1_9BACL|nr:hypothetical protein CD30_06965 [Ureibacillus massiliensis 4400831 = CIP 108448 = CCUG 49529]
MKSGQIQKHYSIQQRYLRSLNKVEPPAFGTDFGEGLIVLTRFKICSTARGAFIRRKKSDNNKK